MTEIQKQVLRDRADWSDFDLALWEVGLVDRTYSQTELESMFLTEAERNGLALERDLDAVDQKYGRVS